jgi:hypothetical protein
MMIHSFVTGDLAAQRTDALRAEADAHRLARVAAGAGAAASTRQSSERPRRRARLWGQPNARPA